MSEPIRTNRELYLAVNELCVREADNPRPLELYLRALLPQLDRFAARVALTPNDFLELLRIAFSASPADWDDVWASVSPRSKVGFEQTRSTLVYQIVDLHQMAASGALEDKYRYFGIDAPRGSRWYNFDTCTYLECGAEGSLHAWEPGDANGRGYVPGDVAILNPDGSLGTARAEEIEKPHFDIEAVTWEAFVEFLWNGQSCE